MTLVYTDSPAGVVGFVDITDPANPVGTGTLPLSGEPTSVAVTGGYALVGVNRSVDFVNPRGRLAVVDIATQTEVHSLDLVGQPDSIAISPDAAYAAVIVENERDEDLGDGGLPQLPAGKLVVVSLTGAPAAWTTANVDMTGVAGAVEPTDPEPEFDLTQIDATEEDALIFQTESLAAVPREPDGVTWGGVHGGGGVGPESVSRRRDLHRVLTGS